MTTRVLCLVSLLVGTAAAQLQREPGNGVNFYSIEKEIGLGNQLAAQFRRETRALESAAALAYVNGIGQRLAAQTGGPAFTYTFELVADDPTVIHEVAAFPGGFLFVPASLILAVKDEDELAGMLAHAIAHVASRDGTRQATRAQLVKAASVPLIYMGGWTGYAIQQAEAQAIPLGMRQVWRNFEMNADRLAAHKMAAAGYDPMALARYIERVQAQDDTEPKAWSPLPQRSERIEAIRAVIASLPAQVYGPHEGLERIQEEVRRLTASAPKAAPSLAR
jgi:predicted Zn-dependent protease